MVFIERMTRFDKSSMSTQKFLLSSTDSIRKCVCTHTTQVSECHYNRRRESLKRKKKTFLWLWLCAMRKKSWLCIREWGCLCMDCFSNNNGIVIIKANDISTSARFLSQLSSHSDCHHWTVRLRFHFLVICIIFPFLSLLFHLLI